MNDRYEVQEKIGQGGIGAVYRAYDTQLKREVAIKRMLPSEKAINGDQSISMMLKEATTLSALQHPNIITVYDVGIDEEGAFVVMELLKGETLDQVIQRGVLTLKDFVEVVTQTMEALIAAEAAGVLHRDLKPTNVMVSWLPSKKFQVKILDFSLAKFSTAPAPQTIDQGDAIFGSIYFMAPEQFERGNLDKRTDLYSMGCLYYFCLTGQYPFQGDSAAQVMASHLQGSVTPLEQIRPDLPGLVCQWVMWLINRYADNRPDDAREAFESMQQITETLNLETGKIVVPQGAVSGQPLANTTTSRKLIVPPVDPDQATGLQRPRATSKRVVVKKRSRKFLYSLAIIQGILIVVAGLLGYQAFRKHQGSKVADARFTELAKLDRPVGTAEDVRLLMNYLTRVDKSASGAKITLNKIVSRDGNIATVEDPIIAALNSSTDERLQIQLMDVMNDRREIHGMASMPLAKTTLLSISDRSKSNLVVVKAYQILGDFGDDNTALALIKRLAAENASHLEVMDAWQKSMIKLCARTTNKTALNTALKAAYDTISDKKTQEKLLILMASLGSDDALAIIERDLDGDDDIARQIAWKASLKWQGRNRRLWEAFQKFLRKAPGRQIPGAESSTALSACIYLINQEGSDPQTESMCKELAESISEPDIIYERYRTDFFEILSNESAEWSLELLGRFKDSKDLSDLTKQRAELAYQKVKEKLNAP